MQHIQCNTFRSKGEVCAELRPLHFVHHPHGGDKNLLTALSTPRIHHAPQLLRPRPPLGPPPDLPVAPSPRTWRATALAQPQAASPPLPRLRRRPTAYNGTPHGLRHRVSDHRRRRRRRRRGRRRPSCRGCGRRHRRRRRRRQRGRGRVNHHPPTGLWHRLCRWRRRQRQRRRGRPARAPVDAARGPTAGAPAQLASTFDAAASTSPAQVSTEHVRWPTVIAAIRRGPRGAAAVARDAPPPVAPAVRWRAIHYRGSAKARAARTAGGRGKRHATALAVARATARGQWGAHQTVGIIVRVDAGHRGGPLQAPMGGEDV